MSFIIQSGSRQYHVDYGQQLIVNQIEGQPDDLIDLDVVYAYGDESKKKTVKGKILRHQKGKKIRVVKYRSKSNYHRMYGPRQYETVLEIVKE